MSLRTPPRHLPRVGSRNANGRPFFDKKVLLLRKGDKAMLVRDRLLNEIPTRDGLVMDVLGDCVKLEGVKKFDRVKYVDGKKQVYQAEALVKIDDVRLVHPVSGKPVNVYLSEDKDKFGRFLRRTCDDHTVIPWPNLHVDGSSRSTLGDHNTSLDEAMEITYTPSLSEPPLPDHVYRDFNRERNYARKMRLKHDRWNNERMEKYFRLACISEFGRSLSLATVRKEYIDGQARMVEAINAWVAKHRVVGKDEVN